MAGGAPLRAEAGLRALPDLSDEGDRVRQTDRANAGQAAGPVSRCQPQNL